MSGNSFPTLSQTTTFLVALMGTQGLFPTSSLLLSHRAPLEQESAVEVLQERGPRVAICCRKADPFQGLKLGSCLTLGNELSEETSVLTKQGILLGKGTCVESHRVRNPGELLCHQARSLRFYGDGISFQVVFGQSF